MSTITTTLFADQLICQHYKIRSYTTIMYRSFPKSLFLRCGQVHQKSPMHLFGLRVRGSSTVVISCWDAQGTSTSSYTIRYRRASMTAESGIRRRRGCCGGRSTRAGNRNRSRHIQVVTRPRPKGSVRRNLRASVLSRSAMYPSSTRHGGNQRVAAVTVCIQFRFTGETARDWSTTAADLSGYVIDVAVITETHFKPSEHQDSMMNIAGYSKFRRDRVESPFTCVMTQPPAKCWCPTATPLTNYSGSVFSQPTTG